MRAALIGVLFLGSSAVLVACTARGSERCRKVCAREARCVDQINTPSVSFDQSECESKCTHLERSHEGKDEVTRHAACLEKAKGCDAVIECMLSAAPAAERPESELATAR